MIYNSPNHAYFFNGIGRSKANPVTSIRLRPTSHYIVHRIGFILATSHCNIQQKIKLNYRGAIHPKHTSLYIKSPRPRVIRQEIIL